MSVIGIGEIIFISTWIGLGLETMIAMWVSDMRGQEFNKDYFNVEGILFSLLVFACGYLSFVISIGVYCHNHKPFTKFMYKMANLGVKRTE